MGADLSAKGCKAAPKQATLVVSCAPRRLVWLPVPGSSRTSPLLQTLDIADKRRAASARRTWERTCPRRAAKRPQNRPPWLYLVHRGVWFCCRFPAVRGRVRSCKPWISRTSEGLLRPQNRPPWLYLVHQGAWFCCRFAAVRGRVRSYKTWISRTSEGLLRPQNRPP
ncbi:hypothetical protein F4W67_04600 [Pseudomonas caricapapayae]|nr:hypothetical protein F4W67_04600 [Pseudomonas caricapapayae]